MRKKSLYEKEKKKLKKIIKPTVNYKFYLTKTDDGEKRGRKLLRMENKNHSQTNLKKKYFLYI